MSEKNYRKKVKSWRAEILVLKDEQNELYFQGYGNEMPFEDYISKFEVDFCSLTVNQVCDFLDKELRENNMEVPSP